MNSLITITIYKQVCRRYPIINSHSCCFVRKGHIFHDTDAWSEGIKTYRFTAGLIVIFNSLFARFPQNRFWFFDFQNCVLSKLFLPNLDRKECYHSTDYNTTKNAQDCLPGITAFHFLVVLQRTVLRYYIHLLVCSLRDEPHFFISDHARKTPFALIPSD